MSAMSSGKRVKKSMPMVQALISDILSAKLGDNWYWPVTRLFLYVSRNSKGQRIWRFGPKSFQKSLLQ